MAATFHYPKTDEERISELKAQVQSKIYQVFGAPSRAFLEFDAADNSILSLGEFIAGMRKYGPACVLAVEPCVPTSTHAHPVYACACAWLCVCVCVRACVCVCACFVADSVGMDFRSRVPMQLQCLLPTHGRTETS